MHSDAELVARMRSGDADAFDTFVRAHYADILAYCTRHCAQREDAQNLTQDVFFLFFRHLSHYRHIGKAKPYLYTIAKNCCINYARKQQAIAVDQSTLEPLQVHHPMDSVVDVLTVQSYIDQLDSDYAEVVHLYYRGDKQIKTIADELNISIPLVKYRLRQARLHLRRLLLGPNRQEHDHG